MYQALYRKWRPQTFDEVIGQEHITDTLKNQISSGRLSHAYLFIGSRGTGKTSCARILSKAVNCENPSNGNPCCKCASCLGITDGSIMDVVELDAASNNSVDNVRALREEAIFSPASVKKRVYIIDEVHMLSGAAFNSLLKILEEPPEHLLFILATTESQKIPATILSRCQRHSFKRVDSSVIARHLISIAEKEQLELEADAAELIAQLSEGGVRDALSILDQCSSAKRIDLESVYSCIGLAGNLKTAQMLEYIINHKTDAALSLFNSMWMDGKIPSSFLNEMSGLLRDSLMLKVAPKSGPGLISSGFKKETLSSFAERMTVEELISSMETIQKALSSMRDSMNPKTIAELCIVSLCDSTQGEDTAQLKARISRLEKRMDEASLEAFSLRAYEGKSESDNCNGHEDDRQDSTSYSCDDCCDEDELDAEMFIEEQPEDSFVQRTDKQSKDERTPVSDAPAAVTWESVCSVARPDLPNELRAKLSDFNTVRAVLSDGVLKIQVAPGFFFGRFNNRRVLDVFAAAATKLCGKKVNCLLSELGSSDNMQYNLEDLKQFKEVKFIYNSDSNL